MNWFQSHLQKEAKGWNWRDFGRAVAIPTVALPAAFIGRGMSNNPEPPQRPIVQPAAPSQPQFSQTPPSAPPPLTQPLPRAAPQQVKEVNKPPANPFVAQVIFAETANTSPEERRLVALTMQNRVRHPGFGWLANQKGGSLTSLEDVVREPNAFEAIGDTDNKQWAKIQNPANLNSKEQQIWQESLDLSRGNLQPQNDAEARIVYYHDKSIGMPKNWNNKYWVAKKEIETPKFIFYSINER